MLVSGYRYLLSIYFKQENYMKVKHFNCIDGYDVLDYISNPSADPEATKAAVLNKYPGVNLSLIGPGELRALFDECVVYSEPGPGAEYIEDAVAAIMVSKANALGEHKVLSADGLVTISDYRGIEYWIKQSDRWNKVKIERLGVALPDLAILDKDVSTSQWNEIHAQMESDRIAALTHEERSLEAAAAIAAVKREAVLKKSEADIADEIFDAKVWFQEKKAEIKAKYGIE
jgi:hypothetical protein